MDEIISTLLGVIVGAIIGFVASYLLWYLQERSHRKTVISAFEIELKRLEPLLIQAFDLLQKIQNPKPSIIDQYGQDNSWE